MIVASNIMPRPSIFECLCSRT